MFLRRGRERSGLDIVAAPGVYPAPAPQIVRAAALEPSVAGEQYAFF
jgi:hypothetical protein